MLDNFCPKIDVGDIGRMIMRIEGEFGVEYAAMQKKAIINSVNNGVMVLTGGPGTGKTTVIRAVIRVFEDLGYKIALAAPTGRAAKRMSLKKTWSSLTRRQWWILCCFQPFFTQ